jgi:hypothetical protein
MSYEKLCHEYNFEHDKLKPVKQPFETFSKEVLKSCYEQMKPNTFFVCKTGGLPEGCTYWFVGIRTQNKFYAYQDNAILSFDENGPSDINLNPTKEDWKQIFLSIGPDNIELSHYEYLDIVIDHFWKLVFDKTREEMWHGGNISAHGDKAYGYKHAWETMGVPFNRGAMLYLLTYTKELGDTPKHESCEWVTSNYQKYLPHILAAEKTAGLL